MKKQQGIQIQILVKKHAASPRVLPLDAVHRAVLPRGNNPVLPGYYIISSPNAAHFLIPSTTAVSNTLYPLTWMSRFSFPRRAWLLSNTMVLLHTVCLPVSIILPLLPKLLYLYFIFIPSDRAVIVPLLSAWPCCASSLAIEYHYSTTAMQ